MDHDDHVSAQAYPRVPEYGEASQARPADSGPGASFGGAAGARSAGYGYSATRLAVVALVAAMLGALVGSGVVLVALERRQPIASEPAALDPPDVVAPIVEAGGHELDRVEAIAAAVLPSVVRIDIRNGSPLGALGNGSGVIYRSDGYIVTSNHVVADGRHIEVLLPDGSRLEGEVVGSDAETDLAVVKIDREGLPTIQLGDSSELRVGQLAVAIGSPFGLEGSVTAGVISGLDRPIDVRAPDGRQVRLPNVVQTDASINPGNSGGALVGGDARLIGINSAILTRGPTPTNAGIGFAVPVNTVVDIADELIERGFVRHAYLGVAGRNLTPELSERLGVERGAYVQGVQPDTPADAAGLRPDDVIVTVEGVDVASMEELVIAIRNHAVGETVIVTYIRDGRERTVEVTLTELPR
jgi:S1-C subfamily serine protease